MAASVQFRPQERTLGMVMKEVDKNLALFLEIRNRENQRDDLLDTDKLEDFDDSTEPKCDSSDDTFKTSGDKSLKPENDRSDYDWLLTPPETPLCNYVEAEETKSLEGQTENPNAPASVSKSNGTNSPETTASVNHKSIHPDISTNIKSSGPGNRRPSSLGGKKSIGCRPATPTGRPSLPATSKPIRPSTPTSRASLPATKTVVPTVRSSTPTRASARSSTPTARSSTPSTSKLSSRSATPTTARSTAPSTAKTTSRSSTPTRKTNSNLAAPSSQSSSLAKSGPSILLNPLPSRGASPTVKSRPSKPSDLLGMSCDPPNFRKSVSQRPNSASRGRPVAPCGRSSITDTSSNRKPRQQSCSPTRSRASNGIARIGGPAMLSRSHGHSTASDDMNPVFIGTKMVERVVNMRKLVPPKQDDHLYAENISKKSSVSQEKSGFGRSLSKKSLDMAIRHMDITRSVAGGLRSLETNSSASVYVGSGSAKSKMVSVSDSLLATSSSDSSDFRA